MTKRLLWIDAWRGLAVIGMVVFHLFLLLAVIGVAPRDLYAGSWLVLARLVQYSFLGLVGISLVLACQRARQHESGSKLFYRQQILRIGQIAVCALGISVITGWFLPNFFIWFGVLHLIAVSSIVLLPLSHRPRLSLVVLGALVLLSVFVTQRPTDSQLLQTIGLRYTQPFSTFDLFPLFPWICVVAAGVVIGHWLVTHQTVFASVNQRLQHPVCRPLLWVGQNALLVYMIHVPVILLVFFCVGLLPWQAPPSIVSTYQ